MHEKTVPLTSFSDISSCESYVDLALVTCQGNVLKDTGLTFYIRLLGLKFGSLPTDYMTLDKLISQGIFVVITMRIIIISTSSCSWYEDYIIHIKSSTLFTEDNKHSINANTYYDHYSFRLAFP